MSMTTIIRKTGELFKHAADIDDGPEWLADLNRRARTSGKGFHSSVEILSPSRAKALLAVNADNRTIADATVAVYAADIENGRWQFNGEPIIVSDTGELNDGQHRCCAVIASGRAIETFVTVGIPREARTTTDMGKARTVGDFLYMHEIADGNNVAAIAAILYAFENNAVSARSSKGSSNNVVRSNKRPTKAATLSYAKANMDDILAAKKVVNATAAGKVGSYSRLAALLILIARRCKDWEAATGFITSVIDGVNLRETSAAHITRERLLRERANRTLSPFLTFQIVILGWNAHRRGRPLARITTTKIMPDISA